MAGVFIQPLLGNSVFIGNDLIHNEEDNSLEGKLYDAYGESLIKGNLNFAKGIMNFDKTYRKKGRLIGYKFRKQGEIWIGEYDGERTSKGEAMCEIFEVGKKPKINWNDVANRAELSYRGNEKWVKNIIQEMEQEGYIEIVKNSSTGEDVVKPLRKITQNLYNPLNFS